MNSSQREDQRLSTGQFLGLDSELETATFLMVEGLIALNLLSAANDFVHLPMQLLGQGLERLLKVEIVLLQVEIDGAVPESRSLKTHDLVSLLERILLAEGLTDYRRARAAAEEDIEFLESDELFYRMLRLLSEFGRGGRYFDLDSVLDPESGAERRRPSDDFARLEMDVLNSHPEWEARLGGAEFRGFYPVLYGDLTENIQRGIRAVARFFAWDLLGSYGKRLSGAALASFLTLRDDHLRTPPKRWFEN